MAGRQQRPVACVSIAALLLLVGCNEAPTAPRSDLQAAALASPVAPTPIDLGGSGGGASAVNPRGQVVGTSRLPGGFTYRAVLWDRGVMTDLGDLGPLGGFPFAPRPPRSAEARAINPAGQVVGNLYYPGTHRAFLWSNGVMTDLGSLESDPLGFQYTYAYGINPAGVVVGTSYDSQGHHAFTWRDGAMTSLGGFPQGLGETESEAWAISPTGVVVGWAYSTSGPLAAVRWDEGVITNLGGLGGNSYATGVNSTGQVVGYSGVSLPVPTHHAVLWDAGSVKDLGTLGGAYSAAHGINDRGQVVGISETAGGLTHAFLWEDGVMTDLGPATQYSGAQGINNAGRIVGWRNDPTTGFWGGVLWR